MADQTHPLLDVLARRVRTLRDGRQWTRSRLAQEAGLSVRFLARVESGDGNISVLRLHDLARALGVSADRLLNREDPADREVRLSRPVALVGLRGAGKSTVGPLLAGRLQVPFVEMDDSILEESGLPLDQLFELHGEGYYRQLERQTVRAILDENRTEVISAAGGVVNDRETWEMLLSGATVIWLRAGPEDHWERVMAQGDRRPMANHPAAMQELRSILRHREPVYAQAHITVDSSGIAPEEAAAVAYRRLEEMAATGL